METKILTKFSLNEIVWIAQNGFLMECKITLIEVKALIQNNNVCVITKYTLTNKLNNNFIKKEDEVFKTLESLTESKIYSL